MRVRMFPHPDELGSNPSKTKCVKCSSDNPKLTRGLCKTCYAFEFRHDNLSSYPRRTLRGGIPSENCLRCGSENVARSSLCAGCYREKHALEERERRAVNQEEYNKSERERSKTRSESRKVYNRAYRKANSETLSIKNKEWRDNNREKYKMSQRVASARRRKRAEEGSYSLEEWVVLVEHYCPDGKCPCCGNFFDNEKRKLSPDHVIPLSKGGTNWLYNIQPLCLECNDKKRCGTTDYRPDTGAFARSISI